MKSAGAVIALFLLLVVVVLPGRLPLDASVSSDLVGRWVGAGDPWGDPLQVELQIGSDEGVVTVYGMAPLDFDAPLFRADGVAGVASTGGAVSFGVDLGNVPYRFRGDRVGDVMSGSLEGAGSASMLRLFRFPEIEAEVTGRVVGVYSNGPRQIGVTWREFGGLRTIDLESGKASTLLPVDDLRFITAADLVAEESPRISHRFLRDRKGEIHALTVGSGADVESFQRRATFDQQLLPFTAPDGVKLAGTLLVPRRPWPVPGVVLVHGSGPIYRSALFQRATLFAQSGFAVLIFDKRGTGASAGVRQGDHFETLISDVRSAVGALRDHEAIDPARVGLQGHSQAGWLIPAVAATDPELAFAIVVNGGGIRPGEQSVFDKENDLRREGFDAGQRARALALMRSVHAYVRDRQGDRAALEQAYLAAKSEPWFETTDLPDIPGVPSWDDPPSEMVTWARELAFDPAPLQRRMRCPVLVLLGEADETVPALVVAKNWRETLSANGHPANRIVLVPSADHGMRIEKDGVRRISPDYARIQIQWLGDTLEMDR